MLEKSKVDNYLAAGDYETLWVELSKAVSESYAELSKEEKVLHCFSYLERNVWKESGKHGFLGTVSSVGEVITGFDRIKKLIQRLEWWPEQDASALLQCVKDHGIAVAELVWLVRALTLHPGDVLEMLGGGSKHKDYFAVEGERAVQAYDKNAHAGEKVCFVTCCNDLNEAEEMYEWIGRLYIPEGMEAETMAVWDAASMCAGYNEAMHSSDARYKVYLHQDVRILNPYFIYEFISAFDRNPSAGMVGMFGAQSVPESGVMWQSQRYGSVVHTEFTRQNLLETSQEAVLYGGDFPAAMADGFLMVTREDIEWREDVFKGWHFYDASQSIEFTRRGFSIIVPEQKIPWCLHDFGQIGWEGYLEQQELFKKTYLRN